MKAKWSKGTAKESKAEQKKGKKQSREKKSKQSTAKESKASKGKERSKAEQRKALQSAAEVLKTPCLQIKEMFNISNLCKRVQLVTSMKVLTKFNQTCNVEECHGET